MAITFTYTFSPNTIIRSSYVNQNFTDASSWTTAHDVTTGVHGVGAGLVVGTTLTQTLTNKTLTSPTIGTAANLHSGADLNIYSDAGTTKVFHVDGATGAFGLPSTIKLFLDDPDLSGNTSIRESAADLFTVETGGVDSFAVKSGAAGIASGANFYFDGVGLAGNTFVEEGGTDQLDFTCGGEASRVSIGSSASTFNLRTFNSNNSTNTLHQNSTSGYSGTIDILQTTDVGGSGFNFAAYKSDSGSDIEFKFRGDGNGTCDGSWTGGGADYAEYFESVDGSQLPLGATVTLENGKVKKSSIGDKIIGVVRPKKDCQGSSLIGNAASFKWSKKYLKDEFGNYIFEDIDLVEWSTVTKDHEDKDLVKQFSKYAKDMTTEDDVCARENGAKYSKRKVRKLNPEFSSDSKYVPREDRNEWNLIGLLGQVPVKKGEVVSDEWILMSEGKEANIYFVR